MEIPLKDLTELVQQIEQLSSQSQAKLVDYVAYLQWHEARAQALAANSWSFSFIEGFSEATVTASQDPAGIDVKMAPATVGGDTRPALWAHPPLAGQTIIEYHVPIPQQVNDVRLHLAIGIRDGAKISEDNLVAFSVRANGMRLWGRQSNAQVWQEAEIPLDVIAGDIARFEFTTEALGNHQWTWAVWGTPELTAGSVTEK